MADPIQTAESTLSKARADLELELARVKLFWAKYGHPALYTLVSLVSAFVGHKL